MRVVSLLPSATEIVASVGGLEYLVGRSHECNYPPSVASLPALTAAKTPFLSSKQMNDAVSQTLQSGEGLYTIDAPLLRRLEPDVIITQSVCAVCSVDYYLVADIAHDMDPSPMVLDLNPQSLSDVLESCMTVGTALGLEYRAQKTLDALQTRVDLALTTAEKDLLNPTPTVAFLEWVDPIFVGGHWTPQLIHLAGGYHALNPPKDAGGAGASFAISNADFSASDPDWIIICPCGLNLAETEKELAAVSEADWWGQLRAVREHRVVLVDGDQMFNRPGPRLVDALEWLVALFRDEPDSMPASFPWKRCLSPSKST